MAIHTTRWRFTYRFKEQEGDDFVGAEELFYTSNPREALRLLYEKHHGCSFLEILNIQTKRVVVHKDNFKF